MNRLKYLTCLKIWQHKYQKIKHNWFQHLYITMILNYYWLEQQIVLYMFIKYIIIE